MDRDDCCRLDLVPPPVSWGFPDWRHGHSAEKVGVGLLCASHPILLSATPRIIAEKQCMCSCVCVEGIASPSAGGARMGRSTIFSSSQGRHDFVWRREGTCRWVGPMYPFIPQLLVIARYRKVELISHTTRVQQQRARCLLVGTAWDHDPCYPDRPVCACANAFTGHFVRYSFVLLLFSSSGVRSTATHSDPLPSSPH